MPEPDAITIKAQDMYALMATWPFPERGYDMAWMFAMCGLTPGSDDSRAVWARVLTRIHLEKEHREKMGGTAGGKGVIFG